MAILKCKMCGGDIELSADKTFGTCEFCGSTMTFPKVDDEQRAAMFNRGNHFRRIGEFDKALAVYERIVQEDENDAEAHWCCALCRFGIEYVEDPNTLEYLPTCHRASFDSFLEDPDYLAALEHSDGITRRQYQKDAAKIAEVQRGILATSQNEEPFDVFICYKETEEDGSRTRDSLYAQDIYYQLTEQGRRVFFSRITLEDKAGTEYEPYIFAALNSAKVMVLVTTSAEHASAVWVKNEWSRFLSLMRKDRSKLLLPCYRDMDPYDLPEALSVLQSYDMSKIGFIQDLTRGINKVLDGAKPKQAVKETVVIQQANANVAPLLKRAFMFLEDGDWQRADDFCEQVLNQAPENAQAYLGKLMAELQVNRQEKLKDQSQPFDTKNNYQKALRFADEKLKSELTGAVSYIIARNEEARKEGVYRQAQDAMSRGDSAHRQALVGLARGRAVPLNEETAIIRDYRSALKLFSSIPAFKDAEGKAKECLEIVEVLPKEYAYQYALYLMGSDSEDDLHHAAEEFGKLRGYKDAAQKERECREKTVSVQKEQAYTACKRATASEDSIDPEAWFAAIDGFERLDGYKDSRFEAERCREKLYDYCCWLIDYYNNPQGLDWTAELFNRFGAYRDSAQKAQDCLKKKDDCIKNQVYTDAVKTMNAAGASIDSLELAARKFNSIRGWQNADELAETCRRRIEQIKAQAEAARIEAERKAEAERLEAKRKAEAERQAEIKRARTKKILLSLSVVAALLIGSFVFLKTVYEPQQAYDQAVQLYNAKQYEESIAAFDALGSYRDSADWSKRIKAEVAAAELAKKTEEENAAAYAEAEEMLRTKDYEKAIAAFSKLGEYRDSKAMVEEAKNAFAYAEAEYLLNIKRFDEAIAAFSSLGSYKDSEQRAESATSEKYTTMYARAESYIQEGKLYEAATTFYSIQEYKDSKKRCFDLWGKITNRSAIAAGQKHTVGLRTDGTVVVAEVVGKFDHYNQSGALKWEDIIAVAAGNSHTVGLKADGTVVAVGNNNYDQCGQYYKIHWEDIVAIAAGGGHTVGLKADGTVVAIGDNSSGQCNVSKWKNIISIAAGRNHTIGLRTDGTVCAVGYNYSGQCDVQNWKDVVKISASMEVSAGVCADGSVVITDSSKNKEKTKEVGGWTDIISIAVANSHTVGLKTNGTVVAYGDGSETKVEDWEDIIAIAAGQLQTVGLRANGTVVAAGPYSLGGRDTRSWEGIKTE